MEREKRIFMDQNDYGKRKAVCRRAAGFMAAVMLAVAGQPSMAYASEKLQMNDPSASEQWAFFNDGSHRKRLRSIRSTRIRSVSHRRMRSFLELSWR